MEDQRKLSVLFVDDETAILTLLPRLLAGMQDYWRMEFAESGAKGLKLMAGSSFDVVVSDLSMPEMNGLEFLKQVRDRHPSAARIIYSSHSDQDSILECLRVIHQFLPKPCPTELLKATIQRAAMVRSFLPDRAMRETVSKLGYIPSVPGLYLKLVQQLQSVETSAEEIARTVSQDIGMTAQILRTVNSAFFGLSKPTSNVEEAIGFLGIEAVKYLVLGIGLFSQFEARKLGGLSLETLWHHSSAAAKAAKAIAQYERAGRNLAEDSFAAGLLHDAGKLVLAGNFPDEYAEIGRRAEEKHIEWLVEERAAFGYDHADVGGYLFGLWGLPSPVVEAVAYHHFPTKCENASFAPLTAVHAANVLIQTQRRSYGGVLPPQIDFLYLAKLGKADAFDFWRQEIQLLNLL